MRAPWTEGLVLLLAAASPLVARASSEGCVPAPVQRAILKAERAHLVRLGPAEERRTGRHEDPPGRFMGCAELERFELARADVRSAGVAFASREHLQCGDWLPNFETVGRRMGVIGLEFENRGAVVRVLVSASEGIAELCFASGVRYPVRLDEAAIAAWKRFVATFARGRRSTVAEFVAAMLEGQPGAVVEGERRAESAPAPETGVVITADSALFALPAPGSVADCDGPRFGATWYVERQPEARTRVAPSYPDLARERGVDGIVRLGVLVGCDGTPRDVFVRSGPPMLHEAAIAAVRQWRFEPASRLGRPVACWIEVPVKFSLH